MIEAGEVGAAFIIQDRASAVLEKISALTTRLEEKFLKLTAAAERIALPFEAVNKQLARTNELFAELSSQRIGGLTGRIEKLGLAMEGFSDKTVVSVERAVASLRTLTAEMGEIGAMSRGVPLLAGPGGGGGGGGGRVTGGRRHGGSSGGPHFGQMGTHLPGGTHFSMPGNASLATLGLIGYGVYQEAEVEDVAAKAMLTGQIKTDAGMTGTAAFKSIRDTIQRVSSQTGFSPKEVGEAILTTERQFGGLSFADRLKLEETLIPYAAQEARMKETGLAESFESLVGLAHMTGTYDPAKLPQLANSFAYTSMITPATLPQFQTALSYSMPLLHAGLDMDPKDIMFLTAMSQTAGIRSTKAGTWLRSFFEKAEPSFSASKASQAHNAALREMGMLDANNHVTWQVRGADGKVDWDASILKMAGTVSAFTARSDPAHRLSLLHDAFGERGGGFGSLMNLPEFIGQFPKLMENMKNFSGGTDILKSLNEASPVQQARNAWADLENVLMDIGQSVLPPLTAGLRQFDAVLKELKQVTGDKAGSAIVTGGLLGGALFGKSILGGLWRGGLRAFGFGGGGEGGAAVGGSALWAVPAALTALGAYLDDRMSMFGAGNPIQSLDKIGMHENGSITDHIAGSLHSKRSHMSNILPDPVRDAKYADEMAMRRLSGNLGPGRSPSGAVSATLQAQVSPTIQNTINLDGKQIAEQVVHLVMPLIEKMMTAAANSMMSGMHNDIASHASPGTVGAN